MDKYIGVKEINAVPMNRREYNNLRGWPVPIDENPLDEGYLVEYLDGGQANHKDFKGYISWSPKEVFERAYRPVDGMTFGLALEALKKGYNIARAGWNSKGMWLEYVGAENWFVNLAFELRVPVCDRLPWIGTKTADGKFVPWLASQTDMLAEDWEIVP